jgi:hypothetical protein
MSNYEMCIEDCNSSISINDNFGKAYYRKAKAQSFDLQTIKSLETIEEGLQKDKENN